jgi:uncharacterized protein YpiB (UPF0302 family)
MSEDKLYELRKDVWTPHHFWRAGMQRTEKEWHKEFGEFNIKWASEWFIDLTAHEASLEKDELRMLIDSVFERKHLHSISYKEAAKEVAELWLKQNQKP